MRERHAAPAARDLAIRIYMRDDAGKLYDAGESYSPADFGGTVPRAGESIVTGMLVDGDQDAGLWWNRTVYAVDAVYFHPDKDVSEARTPSIVLVVSERPMTEQEWELL